VHVNVRSVGVGRVGVCMMCECVSEEGGVRDECGPGVNTTLFIMNR
jgi:hypothetical protein